MVGSNMIIIENLRESDDGVSRKLILLFLDYFSKCFIKSWQFNGHVGFKIFNYNTFLISMRRIFGRIAKFAHYVSGSKVLSWGQTLKLPFEVTICIF